MLKSTRVDTSAEMGDDMCPRHLVADVFVLVVLAVLITQAHNAHALLAYVF